MYISKNTERFSYKGGCGILMWEPYAYQGVQKEKLTRATGKWLCVINNTYNVT